MGFDLSRMSCVGMVIGMVFAGSDSRNITFFTDMSDLFDDIKESTSATDIRLS